MKNACLAIPMTASDELDIGVFYVIVVYQFNVIIFAIKRIKS